MPSRPSPAVRVWNSAVGLIEEYEYPPGRAGEGRVHAHPHMQICLSLDFPGRYVYRGAVHDVPIGAVSVLDAWEPHAPRDPFDRERLSHYIVIYADPVHFRTQIDRPAATPVTRMVHVNAEVVDRFRRLYCALRVDESPLKQEMRYAEFACAVLRGGTRRVATPASPPLLRARDYIAAHAIERLTLKEIAAVADLTPWHFARAFRRRFGIPPHTFQLSLRIDLARRLLATGASGTDVAHRTGFADQSHFIRSFKRATGTTPSRYVPQTL
jgi:AraC-like DNA-binding protein